MFRSKTNIVVWHIIYIVCFLFGVFISNTYIEKYLKKHTKKQIVVSPVTYEQKLDIINKFVEQQKDGSIYIRCFNFYSIECRVSIDYKKNNLDISYKTNTSSMKESINASYKFIKSNF